ncbi:MAG: DedA family protein [Paracoccaceae bacterium]
MTDWLPELVADWGVAVIAVTTFLSCLALPVPASLVMLTGGAFTATGDLTLLSVALAALAGAVLGDQAGYVLGARGRAALQVRIARKPRHATLMRRASTLIEHRGGIGVFLSRWLFSPLGPWVNFVAGAVSMRRMRFTAWAIAGECVWVAVYVGLGRAFAENLGTVAELASDISGLLAGAVVAVGLGLWLRATLRAEQRRRNGR